ncbi:MAG: hypothetical protein HUJ56_07945, partial [Erysipelotrichaceae bacterium]|nr:hypothetical protein [Erysipelotrichaceae bacterium]
LQAVVQEEAKAGDITDKTSKKYAELEERLQRLIVRYNDYASKNSNLTPLIDENRRKTSQLSSVVADLAKNMAKILRQRINNLVKNTTKLTKNLLKNFFTLNGSLEKTAETLKQITKYVLGFRSLYFLMRRLRTLLSEGFENLAVYSADFNASVSDIMSNVTWLKNGLATVLQPVIEALTPAFNALSTAIANAFNMLSKFFSLLTGKNYYVTAKKFYEDYAESLQGASDSAKDLEHQLSGLDEINRWQDNKSSGGSGKYDNVGEMFETIPMEDTEGTAWEWVSNFRNKFLEAWNKAFDMSLWYEAGAILNRGLASALDRLYEVIKWDNISAEFKARVQGIVSMINGFIETPDFWVSLGKTIGAGINTAIQIAWEFITGIGWVNLGNSLALSINNGMKEVDWDKAGEVFMGWFLRIPQTLVGLVKGLETDELAENVRTFIVSALDYAIDWLQTEDWETFGQKIADFISSLFDKDENGDSVGSKIAEFLGAVFDAALKIWDQQPKSTQIALIGGTLAGIFLPAFAMAIPKAIGKLVFTEFLAGEFARKLAPTLINGTTQAAESAMGAGFTAKVTSLLTSAIGVLGPIVITILVAKFLFDFGTALSEAQEEATQHGMDLWHWVDEGINEQIDYDTPNTEEKVKLRWSEIIRGLMIANGVQAEEAGKAVNDGMVKGIKDNEPNTKKETESFGKRLLKNLNDILGIHSPSKETEEMGKNLLQGMIDGLKNQSLLNSVTSSIKDLWSDMKSSFEEGMKNIHDAVDGFVSSISSKLSGIKSNGLFGSLSNSIGGLFSDTYSLRSVEIPQLASGAVIPANR